ncbi:hypothetical protein [Massilia rubra]|uniref:Uncharacterized protein n=1 Tax=Massilia rubra TaxID=2607910 RepID=A0ABX0M001_9BURK|nr:hypothetical protein [Massilia rubra]NHZ38358.1 hypothetical protein [Massilia rubra]
MKQLNQVWISWNLGEESNFKADFLKIVVECERLGRYGPVGYEWGVSSYNEILHARLVAKDSEVQKLQFSLLEHACVFAIKAMRAPRASNVAWCQACQAEHWLGLLMGLLSGFSIQFELSKYSTKQIRTIEAKSRATQRWANDPSQDAKIIAKECWDAWKRDPTRYKSQSSFAIDVLDKVPVDKEGSTVITFNTIVKRYIPQWQGQEK